MSPDDDLIINPEGSGAQSGDDAPKLQVDADWKAQAQAEKERLAAQEAKKAVEGPEAEGGAGAMPAADFRALLGIITQQAVMGLGVMRDDKSGGVVVDLDGARFFIDLLAVLEEKTKGNLTDEENVELTQLLNELRARYVQIAQAVAQSMAAGAGDTPEGTQGQPGTAPGARD